MQTQKITILHSNDMHGDFLAEAGGSPGELIGGLALLSGYLNRVRSEEDHVLYVIAGDMVQGSLIDTEYRGISTVEIMNYLSPDVVTLGNHELDYGLEHLLFLEKMASFPIVNANLYLKPYHRRLMTPHLVVTVGGFSIIFIGIITETVMDSIARDSDVGSFVSLEDARAEIGRICDAYKNEDIDLTVLLTHIGFESDRNLARMLDPAWGVDLIIGGHSHTFLSEPATENGILIAHAGAGTNQIGRFDLMVDDATNSITGWRWELVPISDQITSPDQNLLAYIDSFRTAVDRKYNTLLCRFATVLTHPRREEESSLGNLFSDILCEAARSDVMLLGAGSIRSQELGPAVTLGEFRACFPFSDSLKRYTVTGSQLRTIFSHIMRPENRTGEGECFEVNAAVRALYDERSRTLESLMLNGVPVDDTLHYTLGLTGYHADNCRKNLNIPPDELVRAGGERTIATSTLNVLEEYLQTHPNLNRQTEGRLVFRAS